MIDDIQSDLLSELSELHLVQMLLGDLHDDLVGMVELRNPLSHFRGINDPSNLTRRS